jgi:hypothetical protein
MKSRYTPCHVLLAVVVIAFAVLVALGSREPASSEPASSTDESKPAVTTDPYTVAQVRSYVERGGGAPMWGYRACNALKETSDAGTVRWLTGQHRLTPEQARTVVELAHSELGC